MKNSEFISLFFLLIVSYSCQKPISKEYTIIQGLVSNQTCLYENESTILKNVIVEDERGKGNYIKYFFNGKTKLVFWFPSMGCTSCLDEELFNLKGALNEISNDNVLVISKFDNLRGMKVFRNSNRIDCRCLNIKQDSLGFSFEKEKRPCVFLCDSTLKVSCFFIPERDCPTLSLNYYCTIKKRFFQ